MDGGEPQAMLQMESKTRDRAKGTEELMVRLATVHGVADILGLCRLHQHVLDVAPTYQTPTRPLIAHSTTRTDK